MEIGWISSLLDSSSTNVSAGIGTHDPTVMASSSPSSSNLPRASSSSSKFPPEPAAYRVPDVA